MLVTPSLTRAAAICLNRLTKRRTALCLSIVALTTGQSLARWRGLERGRRRLILRAFLMLSLATAAVALLPFRIAIRSGSVPLRRRSRVVATDCVWAVEVGARHVPWHAVCIQQGLAVQRMLRSEGIDAILHYGARHHPKSGKLEAHVWVTVDDVPVIGGVEAGGFAPVAAYP
jgi:hypothetical protein